MKEEEEEEVKPPISNRAGTKLAAGSNKYGSSVKSEPENQTEFHWWNPVV